MRKTIKKVMIVVPVLITSCQVSLNPNSGPVTAHAATTETAIMNVNGLPVILAVNFAKRENQDFDLVGLIGHSQTFKILTNPYHMLLRFGRQFTRARIDSTDRPDEIDSAWTFSACGSKGNKSSESKGIL
jgi:hypothetical protein